VAAPQENVKTYSTCRLIVLVLLLIVIDIFITYYRYQPSTFLRMGLVKELFIRQVRSLLLLFIVLVLLLKRSTGHTHTPTENNTPTPTHTHTTRTTPQTSTNTSHTYFTTPEGGIVTDIFITMTKPAATTGLINSPFYAWVW